MAWWRISEEEEDQQQKLAQRHEDITATNITIASRIVADCMGWQALIRTTPVYGMCTQGKEIKI